MPHPWFILGAVLAMLGCFAAGNLQGRAAERKNWELIVANQRVTAGEILVQSETARAEALRAYDVLKDKVELDHADAEARIDAAYAAHRALLAGLGGLRDKQGAGGGACRGDNVPAPSAAAGDSPAPTAGCRLSDTASRALLDLARDADRAAAYAASCHDWAMSVGTVERNSK
ncbi:MAG: hypothetical protein K2P94_18095 [Rhodospirillaceae bacterium]|nr:hypothetical protein [Rhodospirillaceae bacterium]